MPSLYVKEVCLSVCLSVCLDIEPKLLEGSQPNFAWVILWYMWETSKYFFGLTSQSGGIVLENLKNQDFPHMARDKGWNPFAARFALFLGGGFGYFLMAQAK